MAWKLSATFEKPLLPQKFSSSPCTTLARRPPRRKIWRAGLFAQGDPPEELLQAIRVIREGGTYYSPLVSRHILDDYTKSPVTKSEAGLTRRELDVLIYTAKGKSIKEMAEILDITPATVQTYMGPPDGKA